MPQLEVPYSLDPTDLYKTTRGAADAHVAIANYLQSVMPAMIDQARIDWGRTEWELPYPKKYGAYNVKQVSAFPAIMTLITRDSKWHRTDYDRTLGIEYNAEWDVKLYIWIHSPMDDNNKWVEPIYENTLMLRDDMATLTRAALLINPTLGLPARYRVEENDMSSDYLEISPAGAQRPDYHTIVSTSFTLVSKETVAQKTYGVVEFTSVEAGLLPPPETITGYVP